MLNPTGSSQSVKNGYTITVTGSDGKAVVATRVLFGDVILCSGQSNMVFPLNLATGGAALIKVLKEEEEKKETTL